MRAGIPAAGALAFENDPARSTVTQANVDALEYSPRYIPIGARNGARYAVQSWTNQGSSRDTAKIETLLAGGKEVIADLNTSWTKTTTNGVDHYRYNAAVEGESHVVLIVGYDRTNREFIVKNSWGENRMIRVSYAVFEQTGQAMSTVDSVVNPNAASPASQRGRALGVWKLDDDGWNGTLTIRRLPVTASSVATATRLGDYQAPGGIVRAVNGYWDDNGRGLTFTIAPVTNPTPPVRWMNTNELYHLDVYNWDINRAAGLHNVGSATSGTVAMRPGTETAHLGPSGCR